MTAPDPWGLTPQPVDPPALDSELGVTTSDDTDPWAPPRQPVPVTNTTFVTVLSIAGLSRLKTSYLRHRARRLRRKYL